MMILKKLEGIEGRMQRVERSLGKILKVTEVNECKKNDGDVKEENVEDEFMVRCYTFLFCRYSIAQSYRLAVLIC